MKVAVQLGNKRRNVEVPEKSKVRDVIREVKVNPETVIVRRGDDILLETDIVSKSDRLEFIRIISGG
ncbi:MAG: MoaD/ThiS family protein [Candidatus Aenigmarchaeota archaeon]|nr:MoaD/ThiS family protein [Candidatus Aenigmarchaeota archaeon]MCK4531798.1 MoaD/ThiS family protein [Candidatus Aenigmarchaeota archaeon]